MAGGLSDILAAAQLSENGGRLDSCELACRFSNN